MSDSALALPDESTRSRSASASPRSQSPTGTTDSAAAGTSIRRRLRSETTCAAATTAEFDRMPLDALNAAFDGALHVDASAHSGDTTGIVDGGSSNNNGDEDDDEDDSDYEPKTQHKKQKHAVVFLTPSHVLLHAPVACPSAAQTMNALRGEHKAAIDALRLRCHESLRKGAMDIQVFERDDYPCTAVFEIVAHDLVAVDGYAVTTPRGETPSVEYGRWLHVTFPLAKP